MTVDDRIGAAADTMVSRDVESGAELSAFPIMGQADVDAVVARAANAAQVWSSAGFAVRRRALTGWAREIVSRSDEFVAEIGRENGKPADDAYMELVIAVEHIVWAARNAERVLRSRKVSSGLLMANYSATVHHEPYGVVGVISPWNYPLFAPVAALASALGAGKTVVLKPSEYATSVAKLLVDCFTAANSSLPDSVLALVTGGGRTGAALVDSAVGKIEFTGSPVTGRRILAACAASMKPVVMECGGKDALIVDDDADVSAAARAAAWGGFSNGGQTCVGVVRIYVVESVAAQFIEALTAALRDVKAGPPPYADYGPMTVAAQVDTVRRHLLDGIESATALPLGGAERIRGRYIDPIILVDCDESSAAVREETFGPIVTVRTVPDVGEAIRLANAGPFGLGAAVFSKRRGEQIAAQLRCGMVSINSVIAFVSIPALPFGGVGSSGYGRIHGDEGLREFSVTKAVAAKRYDVPGMNAMRLDRPAVTVRVLRLMTALRFSKRGSGTQ
ncbi:MAG: gabD2 [Mycobacterium sp.]|nr:gabD2 [Mycobacterium sp.]